MKTKSQIAGLLLVAAVAVGPVWGQQSRVYREGSSWVEEVRGTVPAARSLRISAAMGVVRVQGAERTDVAYVVRKRAYAVSEEAARREFERFRVSASRAGDAVVIAGESDARGFHRFSVDFTVDTPRNLDYAKIDTRGGSIAARNLSGRVDLSSGGGSLRLDDIGGPVTARSSGGSIEVGTVGGDLVAKTGGGHIRVTAAKGRVEANTAGGSIEIGSGAQAVVARTGGGGIDVHQCDGAVEATTAGGSIETGQVGGRVRMASGGGSIRLSGANGPVEVSTTSGTIQLLKLDQGAHVSTGAGNITAEFLGAGASGSALSTAAGDIVVYLSPEMKVSVNASVDMANGHHIYSDFPELKITTEGREYGVRTIYAEGSLNGGGPVLKIRTTTGDINLRRVRK